MSLRFGLNQQKHGFTLIELSIVLVIIGLIVGGVLVGQDLIRTAGIRAGIAQIEGYQTAVNTFKSKYGYIPGDMPTTDTTQLGFFTFTGPYAGQTYLYDVGLGASWGYLNFGFGNNSGSLDISEVYVFWQHLSEAKLIAGAYGGSVSSGYYIVSDTTSPLYVAGFYNAWRDNTFLPNSNFNKDTNTVVAVDTNYTYTKAPNYAGASAKFRNLYRTTVTANQGFAYDTKLDDGSPYTGTVRMPSGMGGCITMSAYDLATNPNRASCSSIHLW